MLEMEQCSLIDQCGHNISREFPKFFLTINCENRNKKIHLIQNQNQIIKLSKNCYAFNNSTGLGRIAIKYKNLKYLFSCSEFIIID